MMSRTALLATGLAAGAVAATLIMWHGGVRETPAYNVLLDGRPVTVLLAPQLNLSLSPEDRFFTRTRDQIIAVDLVTGPDGTQEGSIETVPAALNFVWVQSAQLMTWKKRLRAEIEKNTSGLQRTVTLRRIVPVLVEACYERAVGRPGEPDDTIDVGLKQMIDDLVYIADNFGGVGWASGEPCNGHGEEALTAVARMSFAGTSADVLAARLWHQRGLLGHE